MGIEWAIRGEAELNNLVSFCRQALLNGKTMVLAEKDPKRTLDQNSISHAWYKEIAAAKGDITVLEAKSISKLHCGVPLLMAEDSAFREKWERLIKNNFEYEQKLELMEWFPVTSLMTKKQLSAYLERMQSHWARVGVNLIFPEDR